MILDSKNACSAPRCVPLPSIFWAMMAMMTALVSSPGVLLLLSHARTHTHTPTSPSLLDARSFSFCRWLSCLLAPLIVAFGDLQCVAVCSLPVWLSFSDLCSFVFLSLVRTRVPKILHSCLAVSLLHYLLFNPSYSINSGPGDLSQLDPVECVPFVAPARASFGSAESEDVMQDAASMGGDDDDDCGGGCDDGDSTSHTHTHTPQ